MRTSRERFEKWYLAKYRPERGAATLTEPHAETWWEVWEAALTLDAEDMAAAVTEWFESADKQMAETLKKTVGGEGSRPD